MTTTTNNRNQNIPGQENTFGIKFKKKKNCIPTHVYLATHISQKEHTGPDLRSSIEAASMHLDESGSPHLSTTLGIPPSLLRASVTTIIATAH